MNNTDELIDFDLPVESPFFASHKKGTFPGILPLAIIDWDGKRAKIKVETQYGKTLRWYRFDLINIMFKPTKK